MSEQSLKSTNRKAEEVEDFSNTSKREKSPEEIRALIVGLKNTDKIKKKDYRQTLALLGISWEQALPHLGPDFNENDDERSSNLQPTSSNGTQDDVSERYKIKHSYSTEKLFEASRTVVELPSKGVFYKNGKSSVTIKHLTASDDDILFTPELIVQNKVMDVLLENCVIDKDLRPEEMLTCDREFLVLELRKTGFGNEFSQNPVICNACGKAHQPVVDISKLNTRKPTVFPDPDGMFSVQLPISKVNIRFRLLNGRDESLLQSIYQSQPSSKKGNPQVRRILTEKYLLQIMKVNDDKDKIFIKSFIDAMPMADSRFLRKYMNDAEPGFDNMYEFECPNCGHLEKRPVIMNAKLFYPDADI